MGLTLEQLVATRTKEDLRAQMLLAMQGVGYVEKTGAGEGSLSLSGTASAAASVRISLNGAGGLGSATFKYSTDGGATYSATTAVPSSGQYALPGTGVTLQFANGPGDAADSFYVGDTFAFELSTPTLPTTSWHAGSVPRTVVEVDAQANEDFTRTQQAIARSGFLSTAENAWLDLLLADVYSLTRNAGQAAVHVVRLTDAVGRGPFTIAAGELRVQTATGLRFRNITGGLLAQGSALTPTTLDLQFQAEQRGTAYNVPPNTINLLMTTLSGVSVTNPDLGSGSSLLTQGVNRESNEDARERARLRWPTLGSNAPEDALEFWARATSTDVTRVRVLPDPATPGNTLVYLAGPAGAVSAGVVTIVDYVLEPLAALGGVITTLSAATQAIAIVATVHVQAGLSSSAQAAILANLTALFQGGLNSIGETLPGFGIGNGSTYVYFNQVVEQMQLPAGVRDVVLTVNGGTADVLIADLSVPILSPAPALTPVEV